MYIKTIVTLTLIALLISAEARKTSSRRWGSSGSRTSQRKPPPQNKPPPPPQNKPPSNQGGSTPDKIGWNVPDSNNRKQTSTNVNSAPKPSAPHPENVASKATATNSQSSWNPSGGYPKQPPNNPSYSPNTGQGYNPSVGGYNPSPSHGYNPSVGGGYNPSVGGGYNPSVGGYNPSPSHGYNPSVGGGYNPSIGGHVPHGQPYNPSYGQSYNPSFGQPHVPSYGQVPQQTVVLQSQPYKPGIGQIAKEAFVYAGVSAGVNAAVNRILPGGIYGTRGSGSGSGSGGASHTEITYNNYYNNGTAPAPSPGSEQAATNSQAAPAVNPPAQQPAPTNSAPANPAEPAQTMQTTGTNNAQPTSDAKPNQANPQDPGNNPNPLGFITSNDDIKKLTEDLFSKDTNNAYKYITMKLQGQKKDESTSDDAAEVLLDVKPEAYEIPTVKAALALHDNYELDVKTKETVTSEERKEENDFLDKLLETDILKSTMKFLADKGYIPDDEYEFKDALKRIWFSQFKRTDGEAASSGFETVFLAEKFDSDIIGLHNWIYFAKQEEAKKANYLGYIKEVKLGDKGAIVKIRQSLDGIVQPVTTIFVGTSPELELALYTMCFFTRPNNVCPISLGGTDFMIIANRVNYFGKDILISAYPDI